MARIRSIKPGFFTDEDLADVSRDARLFFIGLWCHADEAGILEDRPKQLLAKVFPHDRDLTVKDTLRHLYELDDLNFIIRYFDEESGKKYIHIRNWKDHQRPHSTEVLSSKPMPSRSLLEQIDLTVRERLSNSCGTNVNGCITSIGTKEQRNKGKGFKDRPPALEKFEPEGEIIPPDPRPWARPFFEQFKMHNLHTIGPFKFEERVAKLLSNKISLEDIKTVYMSKSNKSLEIWDLEKLILRNAGLLKETPKEPMTRAEVHERSLQQEREKNMAILGDDDTELDNRRKIQEDNDRQHQEALERAGDDYVASNSTEMKQGSLF